MEKATAVYRWGEARSSALNVTCFLCNPSPCQGKLFLQDDALAPLWVTGELPYAHGLHAPHKWLIRKSCPSYHSYNHWLYIYYYIKCVPLDISSMNTHVYLYYSYCAKKAKALTAGDRGRMPKHEVNKAECNSRGGNKTGKQAELAATQSWINSSFPGEKNVHTLKKMVTWGTRELVW